MVKFNNGQHGPGRPKGSKNKATIAREHAAKQGANRGLTPLAYMLRIMRSPKADKGRRDDMAKAAAPYLHAKLQSTEIRNPEGSEFVIRVVK